MKFKELLTRSISGIVYVGAIVGCIFWGVIPFGCLMSLFGALAVVEFVRLCGDKVQDRNFIPALILDITGVVFLVFSYLVYPLIMWICVIIFRWILELYMKDPDPLNCLTHSLTSQIYIGLPMACLMAIGYYWNMHIILAIFLLIWINDTGAFIVGCSIGKHRLFERISPKKSWEGFIGGLGFVLIASWLFCIGGKHFWQVQWNVITWLLFGLTVTLFSTWGDLIESLMKRSRQVKDSGKLIPGHGGILDRIDSLLLVMPACFIFMLICRAIEIPFFF